MLIKEVQNVLADSSQFLFDFTFISLNLLHVLLITFSVFLLLDGGEHSPSCSSSADNVLECNRENVSLFKSQFLTSSFSKLGGVGSHFYRCK